MKIVSLLPSGTEIVAALGLEEQLGGITHECDFPPSIRGKPIVVRTWMNAESSSGEIDRIVQDASKEKRSLYIIDMERLRAIQPDVLVTQALCDVCSASRHELDEIKDQLDREPEVLTLTGTDVNGILEDILLAGRVLEAEDAAEKVVGAMRERIEHVQRRVEPLPQVRVSCLEWIEPPMCIGHWMPDMVRLAGGVELLGRTHDHGRRIAWRDVASANPDKMILMPCGFDADRAVKEAGPVLGQAAVMGTNAGRAGEIYTGDGMAYFSRPGPRIVEGIETLAHILHPKA